MRTIKFRGKRVDTDEWVFGFYDGCYDSATVNYLKNGIPWNACVDSETVGEFTGLRDKNGVEIYEGDILYVIEFDGEKQMEYESPVEWIDYGWVVTEPDGIEVSLALVDSHIQWVNTLIEIKVIGNIYDNPELLT